MKVTSCLPFIIRMNILLCRRDGLYCHVSLWGVFESSLQLRLIFLKYDGFVKDPSDCKALREDSVPVDTLIHFEIRFLPLILYWEVVRDNANDLSDFIGIGLSPILLCFAVFFFLLSRERDLFIMRIKFNEFYKWFWSSSQSSRWTSFKRASYWRLKMSMNGFFENFNFTNSPHNRAIVKTEEFITKNDECNDIISDYILHYYISHRLRVHSHFTTFTGDLQTSKQPTSITKWTFDTSWTFETSHNSQFQPLKLIRFCHRYYTRTVYFNLIHSRHTTHVLFIHTHFLSRR